jgi:hypothetical protein
MSLQYLNVTALKPPAFLLAAVVFIIVACLCFKFCYCMMMMMMIYRYEVLYSVVW